MQEGSTPPNRPPYRLSPKEHEELQAQIDDLVAQGLIEGPTPALMGHQYLQPSEERWALADVHRLPGSQSAEDEGQVPSTTYRRSAGSTLQGAGISRN